MSTLPKQPHIYEVLPDGRWKMMFDNHMITDFGTCEQMFRYKHIVDENGLVIRARGGMSWTASFGIWWAHVMEDFYGHLRDAQEGKREFPQKGDLIKSALERWKSDSMSRFALDDPKHFSKFVDSFITLPIGTTNIQAPAGLLVIVTDYFNWYTTMREEKNIKVIGTEATFGLDGSLIVAESDKVVVAYKGRPDIFHIDIAAQIVEASDFKTTGSLTTDYWAQWVPNNQVLGYVVSGHRLMEQLGISRDVNSCSITAIARDIPSKPKLGLPLPRVQRRRFKFTEAQIEEWRRNTINKAERLRFCIENDSWILKETECHFQYNNPCEYRAIDSLSPENRELVIKSDYTKAPAWDPKNA